MHWRWRYGVERKRTLLEREAACDGSLALQQ
jgi:hypothetical protein